MPAKQGSGWKVGDKVEADFNGKWFPAKISKMMTRGKVQVDWGDSLSTITLNDIRKLPADRKREDELFQVSDDESMKSTPPTDSESEDDKKKPSKKPPSKKADAAKAKKKAAAKKPESDSDSNSDDSDSKKKKKPTKKPPSKKASAKASAKKSTKKPTVDTSSEDEETDKKKNKPSRKKAAAKKSNPKADSSDSDSDSDSEDNKKQAKKPAAKGDKGKAKRTATTDDEQTKRPKPDSKKSKAKSKTKNTETDDELDSETILEALTQMEALLIKSKDVDPTTPKGKLAVAQLKALSGSSSEIPKFKKSFTPLLREVRRKIREMNESNKTDTPKKEQPAKKKPAPKADKSKDKEKAKRGEGTDTEDDRIKKPKLERTDSNTKPRKPPSVQSMHAASKRKKLAKEHPDKTPSEINELIAEAWKVIPAEEKSALETRHNEATSKWEAAVKEWEKAKATTDSKKGDKDKGKDKDSKKKTTKEKEATKKPEPKKLPSESSALTWFAISNYIVDVEEALRNGLSNRRSAAALVTRGKMIAKQYETLYRIDFSDKDLTLYDIHKECSDKLRQLQGQFNIDDFHVSILISDPPNFKKTAQQLYRQTVLSDITKDDPKMPAKAIAAAVTERWNKLDKDVIKEWRQKHKEQKDEFVGNYVSKERYRFAITKEQVQKLEEALKNITKESELPDDVADIFKSPEDLKITFEIPSDRIDHNEKVKTISATSPKELLEFAKEVFEITKFKIRDPLTTEALKELKTKYVDALDNSRDQLIKVRTKVFGQFCEPPTDEMKELIQKNLTKVEASLCQRLTDVIKKPEFGTMGWDPFLFEIRDILDELDIEDKQARSKLKPFTFGLSKKNMEIAPVEKLLPHESTQSLPNLVNPTLLRSSLPHHLFGDAVHCWLHLHVFAQAFRLTRFPLHQFIEAVTTAPETKLLKAIFCQLLGCITGCEGESGRKWPGDVTALLAKETELDENDESDTESESDESSAESSSESSEEESDSDSETEESSDESDTSVSSTVESSTASSSASGSASDSDASDSDSSTSDSSSSSQKLTERQKAFRKREQERMKKDAKKAKAREREEKIEAAARKQKTKERKAAAKKKAKAKKIEDRKRRAEEKEQRRQERAKEKEETKLTDEEKAVLREAKAEEEYAAGDYLSEAIRQTIDSARDSNETICRDWDLTTRIILLRGLLRKAAESKQITEALRGYSKKLSSIRSSLLAKEQATNKQHQVSLAKLKEDGTREGKGFDARTTSLIEESVAEHKSNIESLRFESWLESTSNDPCCRPLGSDRHGRLYFKFPTDHRLYVYTHHSPLKTLQESCGVIEGADQDQHTFGKSEQSDDVEMNDVEESQTQTGTQKTEGGEEPEKPATAEVEKENGKEEKKEEEKVEEKETAPPKEEVNEQQPMEVDNKSDDEEESSESESNSDTDAEVSENIPDWVVMNGTWGTFPVQKIVPLLSKDTCQEFALRTKLEAIQAFLPMQQTRKVKRTPAMMDIRKYVNKFTEYGFGYLPDEDKADP